MDARDKDLRFLKRYAYRLDDAHRADGGDGVRYGSRRSRNSTRSTCERLNIVEPDGKLRMVIANRPRSIGPIYKGKPFGYPGGTRPGIIFFNDEGTENGGLTLTGQRGPDGKYQASTHMSFDQFDQDQIVVLNYSDNNGNRQAGLTFSDRTDRADHRVRERAGFHREDAGRTGEDRRNAATAAADPQRRRTGGSSRVHRTRSCQGVGASAVRSHGPAATRAASRLARRTSARVPERLGSRRQPTSTRAVARVRRSGSTSCCARGCRRRRRRASARVERSATRCWIPRRSRC